MKPVTVTLCIVAIAALVVSTCGCTESPSNTTESSPETANAKLPAESLADAINQKYTDQGYILKTPFKETTAENVIEYIGIVMDLSTLSDSTITIVLTLDATTASNYYNSAINDVLGQGYKPDITAPSAGGDKNWVGYYQGNITGHNAPPIPRIEFDLWYPSVTCWVVLPSASVSPYYITNTNAACSYYEVTEIQQYYYSSG